VPFSNPAMRSRNDLVNGMKSGSGRGFGLPPPSKFRSGHLPANAFPTSVETFDSGSNTDMDASVDSEEEGYSGRYSLDSSPQNSRIPNGASGRYGNGVQMPRPRYGSDYAFSDVSSSRETLAGRQGMARDPVRRGAANVRQNGFTEDESSDSAASSEFSSTQVGSSINGTLPKNRAYMSAGYASSVPSRMNVQSSAEKVRKYPNKFSTIFFLSVFWFLRTCYYVAPTLIEGVSEIDSDTWLHSNNSLYRTLSGVSVGVVSDVGVSDTSQRPTLT
jgi:hypothetical protein